MYICGILNCANKDAGASIIHFSDETGEIIDYVAISEERISRVKFPYYSPLRSIKYCMEAFNIEKIDDIDFFVMDWVDTKRFTNSNRSYRKLEVDYLLQKLKIKREKIIFADSHHLAHATSTFYPSNFDEAAILIIDGVGSEMETTTLWKGKGHDIEFIERSKFYGLGQLYTTITRRILKFYSGQEGKTMGLAPYGEHIENKILNIDATYDGLNTDYSRFLDRLPDCTIKQEGLIPCEDYSEITNEYYARIAYEAQLEIENSMIHLAKYAFEKTGCRKLCLAGGVTLNCVTNSMILALDEYDEIFVQPAASDTGIPFGLALWGYHQKTPKHQPLNFSNAYLGKTYDKPGITELLDRFNIPHKEVTNEEVASEISDGNVIGFLTGGSEYGPRALGHRSILGDPRNPKMRDIMNEKVKHREMFRPFAPSVLREHADEYFILNGNASPYMLLAPKVYQKAVDEIPSVIHVDETARVQTVTREESPAYYNLISAFHKLTGTPILLNTSFNDNGEPIVETPLDALLCFMRTNIDLLVLEGIGVKKSDLEAVRDKLVAELTEYRDEKLFAEYKNAINTCCQGYDPKEMVTYLKQQKVKGDYYLSHKTLDDLEDKLLELKLNKQPVTIIADDDHLAVLDKLYDYHKLNISQTINVVDQLDKVSGIQFNEIDKNSTILVMTYNTAFAIVDQCNELDLNGYTPYAYFSKKLPNTIVIPSHSDDENLFDDIAKLSNEANRGKSWDEYFEKVILAE